MNPGLAEIEERLRRTETAKILRDIESGLYQDETLELARGIISERNNSARTPTPDLKSNASKSFFGRSWIAAHWRGDLSLGVSYWLIGFLINVITAIIIAAAGVSLENYEPIKGFIIQLTMWSAIIALAIWQIVGIWRSANKSTQKTKKYFWPALAKGAVILGALRLLSEFVLGAIPSLNESYLIATGDPGVGGYNFRLLNSGTELEYSGGITFGASAELEKFLNVATGVRVIHLNSNGGRIAEAQKMRDLFRKRKLITVTNSSCISACTIAFIGGVERYLQPYGGRLGFHRGAFPGLNESQLKDINNQLKRDIVQFGVSGAFAEKAYETDNKTVWYPTVQELIEARYITGLSQGQFAMSGFGPNPGAAEVSKLLRSNSIFSAIETIDPATHSRIIGVFIEGLKSGTPENQVLLQARTVANKLVSKLTPIASNSAVRDLYNLLLEEMKQISKIDPISCGSFVLGDQYVDLNRFLNQDTILLDAKVTEQIILSADSKNKSTLRESDAEKLLASVGILIRKQHGEKVFNEVISFLDGKSEKASICRLSIIFYTNVLSLADRDAINLLRYIAAQ